jgi:hypothetical protein
MSNVTIQVLRCDDVPGSSRSSTFSNLQLGTPNAEALCTLHPRSAQNSEKEKCQIFALHENANLFFVLVKHT